MKEMMNYESVLSDLFLLNLMKKYNIEQEDVCIRYFTLRFLVATYNIEINEFNKYRKISKFLLDELNIPIYKNDYIIYKSVKIPIMYSISHSIENIIVGWEFRTTLFNIFDEKGNSYNFTKYIDMENKQLRRYGENKAKQYKNTSHYISFVKKHGLDLLNKKYAVAVNYIDQLENFSYPENHNPFQRNLEEIYEMDIHSVKLLETNTRAISESDLESYLIKNLDILESGLRYLESQVVIDNGRIDILAKDKNNCYVIIELKVREDKELVWQSIYYPIQFKKQKGIDIVRMITVAPEYPNHIYLPLKQIDGLEMIMYTPLVELGNIKNINICKI